MNNASPLTRTIAIVEDDPNLLDHFSEIINSADDLKLSGTARTLNSARSLFRTQPDLVLLDIGLPDGSGLSLIPDIRRDAHSRILIITSFGDRETVVDAIHAGADGYLLKDGEADELLDGIRVTLDGGAPISAAAAVYLLECLRGTNLPNDPRREAADSLTEREVTLLSLFARGLSYREAAAEMAISPLTVGNYVKTVYSKLAVHSRSEAVYAAVKSGQLKL